MSGPDEPGFGFGLCLFAAELSCHGDDVHDCARGEQRRHIVRVRKVMLPSRDAHAA